jgi:excisionase family DNA binding protein
VQSAIQDDRIALSADELAERLGLSRKTIFNHTAPRGTLRPIRIGSSVRYALDEIDRWLAERQEQSQGAK